MVPRTAVVFFRDDGGEAPVLDWLREVKRRDARAFAKCVVRIKRLGELGSEIRRPEADYLRDGIYELRARLGTVNYRILYFFHQGEACVLAHGLTKKDTVPDGDISRAIARREQFELDPEGHTHHEQV